MNYFITFFKNHINSSLSTLIIVVLIIIIGNIFIQKFIPRYIKDTSSRYKARKFTSFLSFIIIIFITTIIYSNQLTGFAVFLGVASAGIAFAIQEIIASIAGFLVIHFSSFYKVGDRVVLGGIKGDVIDIGVLRTSLMEIGDWVDGDLYNGKITRIANSFIFKEPVFNYSGDFPFLWDEIQIPINIESDFELARKTFETILNEVQGTYTHKAQSKWNKMTEKFMIEKAQIEPMVHIKFDENWITFYLRYIVDFKARRTTKDEIYSKILEAIKDSNDQIQIASTSINITNSK